MPDQSTLADDPRAPTTVRKRAMRLKTFGVRPTSREALINAEYAWLMKWSDSNDHHVDRGREVLALDVSPDAIKIFWRTQIATP